MGLEIKIIAEITQNIYQENEDDCLTIIDTLFPYLFVACFLFGILFMRIKKNSTFANSNFEEKKNMEFSLLKFENKQKDKDEKKKF